MTKSEKLLTDVAAVYKWLDSQTSHYAEGLCKACGKCCNFENFDHRLFVTPPELIFLAVSLGDKFKKMPDNICPYNISGRCTVYGFRFSGCRIFCCKADKAFQSELSEKTLKKLKGICENFQIPYAYRDLKTALNNFDAPP